MTSYSKGSFGFDLEFLKKYHPDLVLLIGADGRSGLIVLPAYQARAMTSTLNGLEGRSFGWVNHALIASGMPAEHMHVFGGEDRFWMGPEGGQFSIFFEKGAPFTFQHWFVPKELDTEPFELYAHTATEARLGRDMELVNYSGTEFRLKVQRNIRLLDRLEWGDLLGITLPESLQMVGFQTENTLANTGNRAWTKETGLLSVWIAGMFNASEHATAAIPYRKGHEPQQDRVVTSDYFGQVPPDRLRYDNGVILFRADGRQRGKIGLSAYRATPLAGAWDAAHEALTLVQFTLPEGAREYVNSLWKWQDDPFAGDVINSYNDGPNDSGSQMGAFFELETSSPAAALSPGTSITHCHRTLHLSGPRVLLDKISQKLLGIPLSNIESFTP